MLIYHVRNDYNKTLNQTLNLSWHFPQGTPHDNLPVPLMPNSTIFRKIFFKVMLLSFRVFMLWEAKTSLELGTRPQLAANLYIERKERVKKRELPELCDLSLSKLVLQKFVNERNFQTLLYKIKNGCQARSFDCSRRM